LVGEIKRVNATCCVCERDRHACIEKIVSVPIPPMYSGYLFYGSFAPLYLYKALQRACAIYCSGLHSYES